MRSLARLRPSPSMAVALLALFVALGGVSYAVATIDSSDIVNGSVRSKDIKNQTITKNDVKLNTLVGKNLLNGTVRTEDIFNDTIESVDVANGSLNTLDVANGSLFGARRLQQLPHRRRHRRGHARPGELRGQRTPRCPR